LEALIGPGGALGKRLEGYERRAGQELMMRSVATTLERGGSLVVEAGTGIGKSLGYLVPAALSGQRVILSTGTRTLQDQLWERQVPFVRDELGVAIEATVLKGRTNYLCLYLLGNARDNPAVALDEYRDLERIRAWSEKTQFGDRAELADLPDASLAWRVVAADAEQCLGRSCPHFSECFLMAARRRAEAADVVIVNHHLFLPTCNYAKMPCSRSCPRRMRSSSTKPIISRTSRRWPLDARSRTHACAGLRATSNAAFARRTASWAHSSRS